MSASPSRTPLSANNPGIPLSANPSRSLLSASPFGTPHIGEPSGSPSSASSRSAIDTAGPRFCARLNAELLNANVWRMLVFLGLFAFWQLVLVVLTLGGLPESVFGSINGTGNGSNNELAGSNVLGATILSSNALLGNNQLAMSVLLTGVSLALFALFALVCKGVIKSPPIKKSLFAGAFILLVPLQLLQCGLSLATWAWFVNYLVFALLLGVVVVLTPKQCALTLGLFTLCFALLVVLGGLNGLPGYAEGGQHLRSPETTLANTNMFAGTSMLAALLQLIVVAAASIAASLLGYRLTRRRVELQLALEEQLRTFDHKIAARTADYQQCVQNAEAANVAKTRFLTRISHELRSSMNAITGMVFLAREHEDPAHRAAHLDDIEQASRKLADIVNTIIDTTRAEVDFVGSDLNQNFAPVDFPQPGFLQAGYAQAGAGEAGYAQAGFPQTGAGEAGYAQAGAGEAGYAQAGFPQTGAGEAGSTQVGAGEAGCSTSGEQIKVPNLSGHNLLMVEDLPTNRVVLNKYLRETQAQIEEASNGRIAVEMFAASPEGHYSFVFMDLLMPEMSGHDATRAIRSLERADAARVPIIAVSANALREDIEASLAAGMDAHLAKPLERAPLFRAIRERLVP